MLKIFSVIWLSIVSCFSFSSIDNYELKEIEGHQLENKQAQIISVGDINGYYMVSFQEFGSKIPGIMNLPSHLVNTLGLQFYDSNDLPITADFWPGAMLQDIQYNYSAYGYVDIPHNDVSTSLGFTGDYTYALQQRNASFWSFQYRRIERLAFQVDTCPVYPNYYTKYTIYFYPVSVSTPYYFSFYYFYGDVFDTSVYENTGSAYNFIPTIEYTMDDSSSVIGAKTCPCVWFKDDSFWADFFFQESDAITESYQDGYNAGLQVNMDSWYDAGYQNGFAAGYNGGNQISYDNGYSAGYSQGIIDSGSTDPVANSIFNGIFQVGLLPVNVFLEIFNFEVFGINISGFVSGLLTISVVMIVIRFLFGGKNDK